MIERWDRRRSGDVLAITDAALPGENLTEDELLSCLWDDVDASLVVGDAAGMAAGVVRQRGQRRDAFLQLIAVVPEERGRGRGRKLLDSVVRWALEEEGAATLTAGGGAPWYLWPGVDLHATPALCLFEGAGFEWGRPFVNMAYPARHRAAPPPGVTVRRALDDGDATAAAAFVGVHWPHWLPETTRAIEHGACHIAVAGAEVVGFACHSVNRLGWLGPMGTHPGRRHEGTGSALLGAVATDLMAAGLPTVEVSWLGPVRFYAKAAGATVSRAFGSLVLTRPEPASGA